jgi:pre-mRNA-splicing factor CWC26
MLPRHAAHQGEAAAAIHQPGLQKGIVAAAAAAAATTATAAAAPLNVGHASALGAGKDTVYRDKKGRKLEMLSEMMKGPEEAAKSTAPAWGTGLAQQRGKAEKRERDRAEGAKPLARYEIDEDADREKREVMRFDDPMAQHLTRKAPTSSKPKYRGPPAPPNRFDIQPGYRWDGVDRSNGFEKDFFQAHAHSRRQAEQAHSWATHDM